MAVAATDADTAVLADDEREGELVVVREDVIVNVTVIDADAEMLAADVAVRETEKVSEAETEPDGSVLAEPDSDEELERLRVVDVEADAEADADPEGLLLTVAAVDAEPVVLAVEKGVSDTEATSEAEGDGESDTDSDVEGLATGEVEGITEGVTVAVPDDVRAALAEPVCVMLDDALREAEAAAVAETVALALAVPKADDEGVTLVDSDDVGEPVIVFACVDEADAVMPDVDVALAVCEAVGVALDKGEALADGERDRLKLADIAVDVLIVALTEVAGENEKEGEKDAYADAVRAGEMLLVDRDETLGVSVTDADTEGEDVASELPLELAIVVSVVEMDAVGVRVAGGDDEELALELAVALALPTALTLALAEGARDGEPEGEASSESVMLTVIVAAADRETDAVDVPTGLAELLLLGDRVDDKDTDNDTEAVAEPDSDKVVDWAFKKVTIHKRRRSNRSRIAR